MRAALGLSDAAVIAVALAVAQGVRFGFDSEVNVTGPWSPSYVLMSVAIGVAWWLALSWTGTREAGVLGHGPQELQRLVAASWRTFSVVAVIAFLTRWQISRAYLLVALPMGLATLLVVRSVWRLWIHGRRDKGGLQANVLIVGSGPSVDELVMRFRGGRRAGFRVVGVASVRGRQDDWSLLDQSIVRLGELSDPVAQARAIGADYIVVAGTESLSFKESRTLGWALEGTDIGLLVAPGLADVAGPRVKVAPVAGLPLIHVTAPTFSGAKYLAKAVFDKFVGLAIALVLAAPMFCIAVAIRLTSPGPIIFRQQRVGLNGQVFGMLKFRSMVPNAEARLEEAMGGKVGLYYKAEHDPRITPFGRVLRRYSLDELPQIFNVLCGDMSLVGPRPQIAAEVALYDKVAHRRLLVRPGMTGLWQVSGRSSLSPEESIRLDAYYAENWSLGGDIVIMLRTVYAVISPSGAY
ncbi:sugar transferase [Demequina lutea]|uniref:Exopolysaccharide biosynthesis polyprenyl glycosylphosphotransferase n=1 Tax=Demequina lutea TaxID=431489 RepID=A0A7Y9ZA29_9MICO|nr:sugar transferase [Demequina lutea]NYI40448.1 exopolysaccharide biosynthesis polyprenyl glycosylphosphotransferase [Demequina lutea]